jgi:hypothetical protein
LARVGTFLVLFCACHAAILRNDEDKELAAKESRIAKRDAGHYLAKRSIFDMMVSHVVPWWNARFSSRKIANETHPRNSQDTPKQVTDSKPGSTRKRRSIGPINDLLRNLPGGHLLPQIQVLPHHGDLHGGHHGRHHGQGHHGSGHGGGPTQPLSLLNPFHLPPHHTNIIFFRPNKMNGTETPLNATAHDVARVNSTTTNGTETASEPSNMTHVDDGSLSNATQSEVAILQVARPPHRKLSNASTLHVDESAEVLPANSSTNVTHEGLGVHVSNATFSNETQPANSSASAASVHLSASDGISNLTANSETIDAVANSTGTIQDNAKGENSTIPAANVTVPVINATIPVTNATIPAANVTVPVTNATISAANVTVPVTNVTIPAN